MKNLHRILLKIMITWYPYFLLSGCFHHDWLFDEDTGGRQPRWLEPVCTLLWQHVREITKHHKTLLTILVLGVMLTGWSYWRNLYQLMIISQMFGLKSPKLLVRVSKVWAKFCLGSKHVLISVKNIYLTFLVLVN